MVYSILRRNCCKHPRYGVALNSVRSLNKLNRNKKIKDLFLICKFWILFQFYYKLSLDNYTIREFIHDFTTGYNRILKEEGIRRKSSSDWRQYESQKFP